MAEAGLRETNLQRTRETTVGEAVRRFREKGFNATSVAALCAAALVAGCSGDSRPIVPAAEQGQPCGTPDLCLTASCVDGVCCDVACDGPCQVCSKALGATVDGTCTTLTGAACSDAGG